MLWLVGLTQIIVLGLAQIIVNWLSLECGYLVDLLLQLHGLTQIMDTWFNLYCWLLGLTYIMVPLFNLDYDYLVEHK